MQAVHHQTKLDALSILDWYDTIYIVQEVAKSVVSDWGSIPHISIARGCTGFDGAKRL